MSEELPKEGAQQEAVLLAFSNDKTPEHLALLQGLLKMVYHTVLTNKLGVMEALNNETGEVELVLVGIEQNGSGLNCYPLFKPLSDIDSAKYSAPDGKGGFVGRTEEE